jgi:hypothetical protein
MPFNLWRIVAPDKLRRQAYGRWSWSVIANEVVPTAEFCQVYGLGKPAGPLTFEALLDRVDPEDRDQVHEAVCRAVVSGAWFSVMHWIEGQKRGSRLVRLSGIVYTDDDARELRVEGHAEELAVMPRPRQPDAGRHLARIEWT